MFDMAMDTEQKLANTHTMRIPQKTDLLDMADTSLQKVRETLPKIEKNDINKHESFISAV